MTVTAKRRPVIAIATLNIDPIGGIERYVLNLALNLKQRGWSVHCLVINRRGTAFDALSQKVLCYDFSVLPLSPNKVLAVARLVNQIDPDILLLNNCSLMHYALPLIKPSIRPVAVLHSDDPRFYRVATSFSSRIFRWIAPTSGLAAAFRNYIPPQQHSAVSVIPHGVTNEKKYSAIKHKTGPPRIAFVGYLDENKGADLLPEIMQQVCQELPEAQLSVIGYGPWQKRLEDRFALFGIDDRCKCTGPLLQEEVVKILHACDIFLLPTRIEGFGLAIVEAMLAGAVPVVSRLRGITDNIIDDGLTGSLVEPGDRKGFAETIVNLLRNPERLDSLCRAAQAVALERFSADTMLNAYEKLFKEDDSRKNVSMRATFGWFGETICEITQKGVSSGWLLRRVKELSR